MRVQGHRGQMVVSHHLQKKNTSSSMLVKYNDKREIIKTHRTLKSEEPFGQGYHKTKDALSLLRTLKLIASAFSWACFFNRLQ